MKKTRARATARVAYPVDSEIRVMNVLGRHSPLFGYGDRDVFRGTVPETTLPEAPTVLAGDPPAAGRTEPDRTPASQPTEAPPKEAERPSTEAEPPKTKPEKAPPLRRPVEEDDGETYVVTNSLP